MSFELDQSRNNREQPSFEAAPRPELINKTLKNTYALLAATMVVSALAAGLTMMMGLSHMAGLVMSLAGLLVLWLVLPRTQDSAMGIAVVFLFTALEGGSLGPILNHYLAMSNGGLIIMQSLGATALVFFALSAYVLTTGKDFSFMGGFLITGLVIVLLAMVAMLVGGMFGFYVPGLHLALSAAVALLMSGFILYDTSQIIHGGETNYIRATVCLYLDILNLFTSLLHLFSAFGGDD